MSNSAKNLMHYGGGGSSSTGVGSASMITNNNIYTIPEKDLSSPVRQS